MSADWKARLDDVVAQRGRSAAFDSGGNRQCGGDCATVDRGVACFTDSWPKL